MRTCLVVAFFLWSHFVAASDLTFATEEIIKSDILKSERSLFIKLPNGYSPDESTYPVILVLHGQWDTLPVVSTIDLLENELPEFIIVGVESQGMELRPVEGEQTPFAQHLEKEVVPHINKKYSVAPYRILSGHSNSGRFVLDQWLRDGRLFSSYYAFSPSLDDGYIVDKVRKAQENSLAGKAPLIITIANEGEHMQEPFTQLVVMLEKTSAGTFSFKKFPEESHRTTKHPSLQFALRTTFASWVPDYETKTGGLEGLKKHYQELSNKFGFKVAIPTDILQRLTAYSATGQGDEPQAQLNIMVKYILVDAGHSPDVLFEVTDYLINNEYEEAGEQLIAAICDVNNSPKRCSP